MKRPAAVLACALALGACSSKQGARVDPALISLVPSDTVMLVEVQVEELLKTPVYRNYLASRSIARLDDFARSAGLQSYADLWEVLFLSDGQHQAAIGRAKFSNEAEPDLPGKRSLYKTYTLIGDDKSTIFFMSPTVAAVGDTPLVKRMIDARDESHGPPAILAARMKEVPYDADIWSVYAGAPIQLAADAPANLANLVKVLNSIQSGLMYVDVTSMVNGLATGTTKDAASAKELYDALRGLMGIAQLAVSPDRPEMKGLLDGIQLTQDQGNKVNIHLQATEEAIRVLADVWLGQAR